MNKLHSVFLVLGLALLPAAPSVGAQQHDDPCPSSTVYENHNQVDYGPLKVRAVLGTGEVEIGDKTQPGKTVLGACLSLFTEKEHKLVSSTTADSDGHFNFAAVPVGRYRLVARADSFCTANIPIEVVKSSRRKTRIVVHFRPASIDTCSYGEARAVAIPGAVHEYDVLFACTMR